MSESAASAKRFCFMFGAKPAQSETRVRAAAKRRSTRKRAQWKEDAKLTADLGWRLEGRRFSMKSRNPEVNYEAGNDQRN